MGAREAAIAAGLPDKIAYTAKECMAFTPYGYGTILRAIRSGELESVARPGGYRRYVTPEAVERWMGVTHE